MFLSTEINKFILHYLNMMLADKMLFCELLINQTIYYLFKYTQSTRALSILYD